MNKIVEKASEVKDKAKALHDDRTHDSVRKPLGRHPSPVLPSWVYTKRSTSPRKIHLIRQIKLSSPQCIRPLGCAQSVRLVTEGLAGHGEVIVFSGPLH
jgi:hypothetical protein